jgi:hypothetical protein
MLENLKRKILSITTRNSSPSGRTLTLVLLRLMMRGIGGEPASEKFKDISA